MRSELPAMSLFSTWMLPLQLFGVWFLWAIAAAAEKRAHEIRCGTLEEQRGGVSIFPAIPLFPLLFWGVAWLVDRFFSPWGSTVVGGLHTFLALLMLVTSSRGARFCRQHDRCA